MATVEVSTLLPSLSLDHFISALSFNFNHFTHRCSSTLIFVGGISLDIANTRCITAKMNGLDSSGAKAAPAVSIRNGPMHMEVDTPSKTNGTTTSPKRKASSNSTKYKEASTSDDDDDAPLVFQVQKAHARKTEVLTSHRLSDVEP